MKVRPFGGKAGLRLFLSQLFYLVAILNLIYEDLSGLETWNKVFVNNQCGVSGDVTGNFLFALLVDKTSEAPNVNIVSIRH